MLAVKKVSVKTGILLMFFLVVSHSLLSQNRREAWVDSVFNTLNTEEKLGQLILIRVGSLSEDDQEILLEKVKSHHISGAIFTSGSPVKLARLVNKVQGESKVPLLFGVEATTGVGQSIDSVQTFAPPLMLSALKHDSLIALTARTIAEEMKMLGLHINFVPLANFDYAAAGYPNNLMHFGDNRDRVTAKASLYMEALQNEGIIACAQHNEKWINRQGVAGDKQLFYQGTPDPAVFEPYRLLMDRGLKGIHTTHLPYFYLEKNQNIPSVISRIFISEQIKRSLGFKGLTFTDIPELRQIVEKPRGGETEMLAFQVGNDFLIDPTSITATLKKLRKDLKKNQPLQDQLDATVKKILAAKYNAGLAQWKALETENLKRRLNSVQSKLLQHHLMRESITLVENANGLLPVGSLENKKFLVISIGKEKQNDFAHTLGKYVPMDELELRIVADTIQMTPEIIKSYDMVFVGVFPYATQLIPQIKPWLDRIQSDRIVLCHFGDPLQITQFPDVHTVMLAYADNPVAGKSAAQMIFGAMPVHGELPININDKLKQGTSLGITTVDRFSYVLPEEAGMDSKTLEQVAIIARQAIDSGATPGCHVLVAHKGKVVMDRSFGWYTYENQTPVSDETIYDLASITKVAATLQTVMFLYEKGMIDINKKVSKFLPDLANTNKKDITIKDVLTHQSGLLPFIPMWPQTVKDKELMPYYYSNHKSESYPMQVASDLFVAPAIADSAWKWALNSKMIDRQPRTPYPYRYSDMGSMIFKQMAEHLLNQPMADFLSQHFYEPLGAGTMGFTPLQRFPVSRIAPTEVDTIYRKRLIHGTVHDERAAMLGGVAGHAGLFGNANDLAKIGQMLLNKGSYGGVRYFKPETVEMFTAKQYDNSRRGLGWDKPVISDWNSPTTEYASAKTFGHTGFTGTCIWVDPEFDLVFVFLSNRVWPDRNNKLLNANIRPRIQEVLYKSIFNYAQNH